MRAATKGLPLPEVIDHVLEHSGLRTHYKNDREGRERLENLDELMNAAANFTQEDEDSLTAFLTHAALESGDNQAQEGQDAVQLMTVHSAKGLEFNHVFITGLEDGLFPHENSIMEKDGLDEERRLMYVAITRARQRLYLSFAQTRMLHGQTRYNMKSRFFDELPDAVLKWLTPQISARRGNLWQGDDDFAAVSRPAYAKAKAAQDSGYRIGQNVAHAKFGAGVIVNSEGSGQDARVQVNFGRNGMKWLALAYAKLDPV
jgi:DNA helicase-2/ATP-dependent DNA helicase PcrA